MALLAGGSRASLWARASEPTQSLGLRPLVLRPRSLASSPARRLHVQAASTAVAASKARVAFVEDATEDDFHAAVARRSSSSSSSDGVPEGSSSFSLRRLFGGSGSEATNAPSKPPVVLALFTATWCGPCSLLYKELSHTVALLPSDKPVTVLVLDVDRNHELASALKVSSLPTMLFLGPNGEDKPPLYSQGFVRGAVIKDVLLNKAPSYAGSKFKDNTAWLRL